MASQQEEDDRITRILTTLMAVQERRSRPSRVDLDKLTMSNYPDWAKKMKYALLLSKLWVDPTLDPTTLTGTNAYNNKEAVLFMACYLDTSNSSFINETNETCFITAWNDIKKFHQPRSATELADIHSAIQNIKHQAGQPIETHLMKLEAQFARFHEVDKKLDDAHLVALILASIKGSSDFTNVMHSAMWEDTSSLTIGKVKSVLISSQHQQKSHNEVAHKIGFSGASSNPTKRTTAKRHNRKPADPIKGWNCSVCERDNHTPETCFKRISTSKTQHKTQGAATPQQSRRANHVDDDLQTNQHANIARAYAGHSAHDVNTQNRRLSPRRVPYSAVDRRANNSASSSVKSRLGEPVGTQSAYQNILPKRLNAKTDSHMDDYLEIDFEPNYEVEDAGYDEDRLLSSPPGKLIDTSRSIITHSYSLFKQDPPSTIKQSTANMKSPEKVKPRMNHFNVLNSNKILNPNRSNLSRYKSKHFNPVIRANCNEFSNTNKSQLKSNTYSSWIVDSGATMHMCMTSDWLSDYIPQSGNNAIISDGTHIPIIGYGTLIMLLEDDQNKLTHKIVLENVAVIPKLSVNLIAVKGLTSLGYSVQFTDDSCYIQRNNLDILFATEENSAYILKISNPQHKAPDTVNMAMFCIHEWHRKMSHRNLAHINKVKDVLNLTITKCDCPSECIGCLKGKFHALPFPQASQKPTKPRDIITTDVCGPFRTASIGGSNYFVTFTCANTHRSDSNKTQV